MRTPRPPCLAALLLAAVPLSVRADDLLPPGRTVEAVIDHYIDARLTAEGVSPAAPADDATLIRRTTLDLAGRIPTVAEAAAYRTSTDPAKRAVLVNRLMASPVFARFQAAQLDAMLNSSPGGDGRRGSVRGYLQTALGENKPWDAIFRDLVLPDRASEAAKKNGAAEFLKARLADPDRLTNDVSVAFFGVNVSCAQCHDHPLVADWKQDHFYGMKSFFARTYDAGGQVAERPAGLVKFKPTKGPERSAKLMFLTGATADTDTTREPTKDEQKADKERADKAKGSKTPPPPPAFSARAKLVELALAPGQDEFFARSVVNRLWHQFFGHGLVNPLDQMHSENPPTHPDLLAWLARDLSAHGYDLRRLVRGIVSSRAYARASVYPSESMPPPEFFAVARLRPLTPVQLATSLKLATTDPGALTDVEKRLEGIESAARGFAATLAGDSQIGVGEALLFSNGDRVEKEFLSAAADTLLARVKEAKSPEAAVDLLVNAVYTRPPTAAERAALTEYISRRAERPADAHRQVLWALLTSPEFRFCH